MDGFSPPMKDRTMGSRCWISLVLLAGLFLALLSYQPFLRIAAGAESRLLSLDMRGEPLGEVLKKFSKDAGYLISFDSEWEGLPVSVSFKNLTMVQGLRRILAQLNYSLVFNDADRRISIVIKSLNNGEEFSSEAVKAANNSPPGTLQSPKASLGAIKNPGEIQVIPPQMAGETGITKNQLEQIETSRAEVDPGSIEVTPPSKPGERGVTLKQIEAQNASQRTVGIRDANPVPPDNFGHN
jgi:hypothetical protein